MLAVTRNTTICTLIIAIIGVLISVAGKSKCIGLFYPDWMKLTNFRYMVIKRKIHTLFTCRCCCRWFYRFNNRVSRPNQQQYQIAIVYGASMSSLLMLIFISQLANFNFKTIATTLIDLLWPVDTSQQPVPIPLIMETVDLFQISIFALTMKTATDVYHLEVASARTRKVINWISSMEHHLFFFHSDYVLHVKCIFFYTSSDQLIKILVFTYSYFLWWRLIGWTKVFNLFEELGPATSLTATHSQQFRFFQVLRTSSLWFVF